MTKTVSGTTTIEAQYGYDPYGIATKLQGSQDADFQYASYYMHPRSGLNLPVFRAYSSTLGRFISRDPIGESAGANLYSYTSENPIGSTDPLGLYDFSINGPLGVFGPGVANLGDIAFDFAIANTSLEILSAGGWGVFGGPVFLYGSARQIVGGGGGRPIPTWEVSASKNPQLAENIGNALGAGFPNLLRRGDPSKTIPTRNTACSAIPSPRPYGLTADEYPPAATLEAQANPGGSWVGLIEGRQNSSGGGLLIQFFNREGVKIGDAFYVKIVP